MINTKFETLLKRMLSFNDHLVFTFFVLFHSLIDLFTPFSHFFITSSTLSFLPHISDYSSHHYHSVFTVMLSFVRPYLLPFNCSTYSFLPLLSFPLLPALPLQPFFLHTSSSYSSSLLHLLFLFTASSFTPLLILSSTPPCLPLSSLTRAFHSPISLLPPSSTSSPPPTHPPPVFRILSRILRQW